MPQNQSPAVAKLEAQFSRWSARIEAMRTMLEQADLEGRVEFHRQVDASQEQHEIARRHLDELERSGADALKELKEGVEAAMKELTASLAKSG